MGSVDSVNGRQVLPRVPARARSKILHRYLQLVKQTSRFNLDRLAHMLTELQSSSIIWALWHQESYTQLLVPLQLPIHVFVAGGSAGELYQELVNNIGFNLIRAQTATGTTSHILTARNALLRTGTILAIAVDGPYGPPGKAKVGAALLAKLSGAAIAPVHTCIRHAIQGGTWDRRWYPLPLNDVAFIAGPLIRVDRDADRTGLIHASQRIQAELDRLAQIE